MSTVLKNLHRLPSAIFSSKWLEKKQTSIISAAMVITVASFLVAGFGLLRDRVLLSMFAQTEASRAAFDAYRVAFQVPDMLYQLIILGALSASFIPVFTNIRKKNESQAFQTSNSMMNILLLFFMIATLVVFIFAEQITNVRVGAAYSYEQIQIVINLTRIMMLGQIFFAVSSFFSGMLQSYHKFILPAIAPLFYNIGIILGAFLLYDRLGIYGAGVGMVFGAFLHMLSQYPSVRRQGWRWQAIINTRLSGVKSIFSMMPARTLTLGVSEIQGFALSFFVTQINNFGFTLITLARSLMILPIRLVGVPIGQAALPFLSDLSDENTLDKFKKVLLQSLNQISFLAFPAAALLLILRIPAVRLVYGVPDFPWELTVLVGRIVAVMAISIPFQAMFHLLVRGFYALKDTRTPFIISCITTLFFVGGSYMVTQMENPLLLIAGIISATAILETLLYCVLLQRKVKGLFNKDFIVSQTKIAFASVIMTVALYTPFRFLDQLVFDTTRVVPLLFLTATVSFSGIAMFILVAHFMKIKEMSLVWSILTDLGLIKKEFKTLETTEMLDRTTEMDETQ